MGFLNSQAGQGSNTPFSKKQAPDTKVVKVNADLHYILNVYKAKSGGTSTITDLINQAVTEYIQNHPEIERVASGEKK